MIDQNHKFKIYKLLNLSYKKEKRSFFSKMKNLIIL